MIIQKKKDDIEDFNFDNKKKGGTRKKEKSDFNKHGINIDGVGKNGYNINGIDGKGGINKDGFNINGIKGTRKKIPKQKN